MGADSVSRRSAVSVLSRTLEQLKLSLHPILPVLTSEVHSHQPRAASDFVLAGAGADSPSEWVNPEVARAVERLLGLKEKAVQATQGCQDLKACDLVFYSTEPLPTDAELREISQSASARIGKGSTDSEV